ncbi:MAG: nickel pincer cofactor biosynthesis protein LarB [Planctomycetes bacterium]|nr:nickel pincer cofactor biosynthesis protein LarB [Planctomycetota bacterium]
MDHQSLIAIAQQLAAGALTPEEFAQRASQMLVGRSGDPGEAAKMACLPTATLDLDRRRRCGFPEVVYGQGKSADQLREIFDALLSRGESVFATRISPEIASVLLATFPTARYNEPARTFRIVKPDSNSQQTNAFVAILTAGTSDFPVAEEARETLDWMGVRASVIYDVGVAGPHRLPARLAEFEDADAIVVVAGMEGALPSVVGGYVSCPIIAVPTSVGYGANFGGVSALLSMLNSCASNVAVVNIDAGFRGGYLAGLIATRRHCDSQKT